MIWFTADHHFFHRNIIRYCRRPFADLKEMHEHMITEWNAVVGKGDTVHHLGDISLGGTKQTRLILGALNGKKFLYRGSHERSAIKCGDCFEGIFTCELVSISGQPIFLAHHCHKVWPQSHFNSWHLFAHSHTGLDAYAASEGKLLDVGVDGHNFRPWSIEEIEEVMDTRPDNFNFVGRR
jgi:calcineurin-like phosphoesterase family protein